MRHRTVARTDQSVSPEGAEEPSSVAHDHTVIAFECGSQVGLAGAVEVTHRDRRQGRHYVLTTEYEVVCVGGEGGDADQGRREDGAERHRQEDERAPAPSVDTAA